MIYNIMEEITSIETAYTTGVFTSICLLLEGKNYE